MPFFDGRTLISARLMLVSIFLMCGLGCDTAQKHAQQILRDDRDCPRKAEDLAFVRGERLYAQTCSMCHKLTGDGQPGSFPPIRHHAGRIAKSDVGREYLIRLLLWGQREPIEVEGRSFNNVMPAQAVGLTNAEVTDVLNYISYSFGNCRQTSLDPIFDEASVIPARAETKVEGQKLMAQRRKEALSLPP